MNVKKTLSCLLACFGWVAGASGQTVIKPGTAIKIDIRGVPAEEITRVTGEYLVSDSGTVNMPLLGQIGAAGMSPSALGSRIEAAYKANQIYKNPTILVISSTENTLEKLMVHVGGQVRKTGPVEFTRGLTIYQAVQAAGGPTEFGAINRVQLLRNGKVQVMNLKMPQFMNFELQQNDTITVPEKNPFGR
jgi:protein involved in polysaccharide export with SLBB domain